MTEQKKQVLLVDDDREVLNLNGEFLKKKGYSVVLAEKAADALAILKNTTVHCIVLDVMMPEMDGFTALGRIRELTDAPVLFLTGKAAEEDRIRGLSEGADDYILKPCSLEELSLRIMINIKKAQKLNNRKNVLEFPPLRIELVNHKAFCYEEEIILSNREYDLLVLLARNPGVDMTFEMIGKALYNSYMEADRKNIMVTASRLRKKLEEYVGMEKMIETVWGKGYRFKG